MDAHSLNYFKQVQSQLVADTMKLISHPDRLLVLCELADEEKSVAHLVSSVPMSQSYLSQSLSRMYAQGVLSRRRDGGYVYYGIKDEKLKRVMMALYSIYCNQQEEK